MLRVARVSIQHIAGIEQLEFEPGKSLTLISGENGSGKSSVIRSVLAAIGGGSEARLVRKGKEQGETVILLDDPGTTGKKTTIRKVLKADASKKANLSVKSEALGTLPSGEQRFIESLFDLRSANPLELLRHDADTKEDREARAKWFLESIPLQCDSVELAAAAGVQVSDLETFGIKNLHPLEAISRVEKLLEAKRRELNSLADDRESTVSTLAAAAPPESAGEVSEGSVADQRRAVEDLKSQRDAKIHALREDARLAIKGKDEEAVQAVIDATKKRDAAIQLAREEFDATVLKAHTGARKATETVNNLLQDEANKVNGEYGPSITAATVELDRLERALQDSGRIAEAKRQRDNFQKQADDARAKAKAVTANVDNVRAMRQRLISQNPIEGLDVSEAGDITIEGVPWPMVNTARRITVAIKLAEIRAGKIGLCCCDGLEALDLEHQREFVEQAVDSGVQWLCAVVGTGPLKIQAIDSVDEFDQAVRKGL